MNATLADSFPSRHRPNNPGTGVENELGVGGGRGDLKQEGK